MDAGKLLLATVFSALLANCSDSAELQVYVATQWKDVHDELFKGQRTRELIRYKHLHDHGIDRMDDTNPLQASP